MEQAKGVTIPVTTKARGGDGVEILEAKGPEWTLSELQTGVGASRGKVYIETVPLGEGRGEKFLGKIILQEFAKSPDAPPIPDGLDPEGVAPVVGVYAQSLIQKVIASSAVALTDNWTKEPRPEDLAGWAIQNLTLVVDEEALLKDNPEVNLIASLLTGLPIHNHAVLIRSADLT